MRFYWVAPMPILFLAGCVNIPPILAVASYAADGISFVASGKSVSDHGISYITGQDCAVWRVVKGESVCHDPVLVASATVPRSSDEGRSAPVAAAASAEVREAELRLNAGLSREPLKTTPPGAHQATPKPPVTAAIDGRYLVLGSFVTEAGARSLAHRHSGSREIVAQATVGGRNYYRLLAGPLGAEEMKEARSRALSAGIRDAWVIDLCQDNLRPPPCRPVPPAPGIERNPSFGHVAAQIPGGNDHLPPTGTADGRSVARLAAETSR